MLLFSLLAVQLDPGGMVICMAENGNLSYSLNCTCDSPLKHANSHGCSACDHSQSSAHIGEVNIPQCCAERNAPQQDKQEQDGSCCHNFSVDLMISSAMLITAPSFTIHETVGPMPAYLPDLQSLAVRPDFRLSDLPPPLPDRLQHGTSLIESVRLLL